MPNQTFKDKLQERMTELKTLRDQIGLDLHFASMELRSEWKDIEKKLPNPAQAVDHVKDVTTEAVEMLSSQLRSFRERLRPKLDAGKVSDIMTKTVTTCAPSDTLATAVALMWDQDIGSLPVVDQEGRLAGMITDRDAAVAACTQGKRMDDIAVADVMARDISCCTLEHTREQALSLMESQKVRRRPVVGTSGKIEGIVTLNDAAQALLKGPEDRAAAASRIVTTLLAICEKRTRNGN